MKNTNSSAAGAGKYRKNKSTIMEKIYFHGA